MEKPDESKNDKKSALKALPKLTNNIDIPLLYRHKGLLYIIEKASNKNPITPSDVQIFLSDLGLPPMSTSDLKKKFKIAGGGAEGLTRLSDFFVFVVNELRMNTETEIFDSFDVFDSELVTNFFG